MDANLFNFISIGINEKLDLHLFPLGRSSIFHRHALYNTETYHNEYDYESIMHFQRNSYSKRPELYTLQARKNQNRILGGVELSKLDIEKLNQMFCPSDCE